jgi:actin-like ATPase involved in cell morphogenesis
MKVIGVDLGTTNSCVYYLDELGNPVLVQAAGKYKIFPSVVWSAGANKEIVVGHAAKQRVGQRPAPVLAVKRLMGTTQMVRLGEADVSPVDVSAEILRYVKRQVEEVTKDEVGGVIVTVPAYFDSAPKNDTYQAALRAFFDGDEQRARGRITLESEPEAAAYAYASEDTAEQLRVLVFDLGGGTFDVTVLEKSRDAGLTVLKFGGDPHLGGDNIDDRIATWFTYLLRGGRRDALDRILGSSRYPEDRRYTILQQVLTNDEAVRGELHPGDLDLLAGSAGAYALDLDARRPEDFARIQVLKWLAERAKIDLTSQPEALIAKQGAFEDQRRETVDIDLTLTRSDFDRLIGDFIAITIECTQQVLRKSGVSADSIDRILLVGGSSRMPIVKEELEKICNRPIQLADPDLIVARGAAIRARALMPPPLRVKDGQSPLAIECPTETPEERVAIRGDLGKEVGGHAYLLQDGREVGDAPIAAGRFTFTAVRLEQNTINRFHVEAVDEREQVIAEHDFVIRHDERAADVVRLGAKVTKPIRALGTRGYQLLFPEGTVLPCTGPFICRRATNDDHIDIEFYEGDRHLATLHIANVDPALPISAQIDLTVTVTETFDVSASAVVTDTKQAGAVEFRISRLEIPPLAEMNQDFAATLEQVENDLDKVSDINQRLVFSNRMERLAAHYDKSRKALSPDLHKLYSTIGELRTLLVEIRAAHVLLEPPLEEFEGLIAMCRGKARNLPESSVIKGEHVAERLGSLQKAGQDAWKREDAVEWRHVNSEVQKVHEQLTAAIEEAKSGGGRNEPVSPQDLQRAMMQWLAEIRGTVEQHKLADRFAAEIRGLERAIRDQDLRDADQARRALFGVLDSQLRPLDHRVDRAVREAGGTPRASTAKIYF